MIQKEGKEERKKERRKRGEREEKQEFQCHDDKLGRTYRFSGTRFAFICGKDQVQGLRPRRWLQEEKQRWVRFSGIVNETETSGTRWIYTVGNPFIFTAMPGWTLRGMFSFGTHLAPVCRRARANTQPICLLRTIIHDHLKLYDMMTIESARSFVSNEINIVYHRNDYNRIR